MFCPCRHFEVTFLLPACLACCLPCLLVGCLAGWLGFELFCLFGLVFLCMVLPCMLVAYSFCFVRLCLLLLLVIAFCWVISDFTVSWAGIALCWSLLATICFSFHLSPTLSSCQCQLFPEPRSST